MSGLPAALADALQRLSAAPDRPVVLIDGGAGSGKTTLANRLVVNWPGTDPVQLVSLDDLYPGWSGLAAGSAAVPGLIGGAGFRSWDWESGSPGPWRALDPSAPLILEGCGALTRAGRAQAGLTIWIELAEGQRRRRAIERDGEVFAAHWDEWATQEAAHWVAEQPWELADITLRGTRS